MSRLIRITIVGFTVGFLVACSSSPSTARELSARRMAPPTTTTTTIAPTTTTTVPPAPTTTTSRPTPKPAPIPPAATSSDCAAAENALRTVGATDTEIRFAIPIADRESNCTLTVVADRPFTGDYSWGPWQINYYGNLYDGRVALLGSPDTNTASWESAAENFLTLLRVSGACHWQPPNYCA